MEKRSVEAIVRALNEANVRYLIAGGLAVVAHGYLRYTADVDLILDLEENNVQRALAALQQLGYRPRVPVLIEQFIAPDIRAGWIKDKGMLVFSLFSDVHPKTIVDLFAENPLDFEQAYALRVGMELEPGLTAPILSLEDLITLKRQAGRPKDLDDIHQLDALRKDRANE